MKPRIDLLKSVAWIIIGLWLTRSILFRLLNIDFVSMEVARDFRQMWLILIPFAVGILIVKSWKEHLSGTKKILGLSAGIVLSTGLILVLNFFSGFCEWRFTEPLIRQKVDNIEIRKRYLDCGAGDSDPTYQLVETYSIGNYLLKYSEITEEEINGR